jgi:AcrR family transcriptional regulator
VKSETAAQRRPGRPRSAQADLAIARATVESILEQGVEGMSMEGVAARAGVSKATIYRRYASKEELVVEVVGQLRPPGPPPDQGSFEADIAALVGGQAERAVGMGARIVSRLIAAALNAPELRALLVERMIDPFRAIIAELVRRGIERGELREDLDVERAVDILHGSLVYRLIIAGGDPTGIPQHAERLLPLALEGMRRRA